MNNKRIRNADFDIKQLYERVNSTNNREYKKAKQNCELQNPKWSLNGYIQN